MAHKLRDAFVEQGAAMTLSCPSRFADTPDVQAIDSVSLWAQRAWEASDALLFVSACGIATRAIAPLVHDKFCDPAVVCVDESAAFAVPLLSGHVGGANELARRVAGMCGAQPVVTTATDVNGLFSVDEWARRSRLVVLDRDVAKLISAKLLENQPVGFASDFDVAGTLPRGVQEDACAAGFSVSHDADKRPFAQTLRLVPHTVVVGVGCKRGAGADAILSLVDSCLAQAHVAPEAVCALASIDVKADEKGLTEAARRRGWNLRLYSAEHLAAVSGNFSSSEFVRRTVGVDNVCERAACADGAMLLLGKRSSQGVTVAVAATEPRLSFEDPADVPCGATDAIGSGVAKGTGQSTPYSSGEAKQKTNLLAESHSRESGTMPKAAGVVCVGLGPGGADDLTLRAHKALQSVEVIVGYTTYVNLIRDAYPHAEFVTTAMRGEERRCRMALEHAAAGRHVAVVCSGDPGVYGMAGLLYELAPEYPGVRVEVVPGVSAANGGAAVLGAPLMHDWCSISLSDLMTPWAAIEARLRAAAQADSCISLYNPGSHGRAGHLRKACDILLEYKDADTICGYVRNIGREGQSSAVLTLAELRNARVDMLTCVFVGNSSTKLIDGHMVTPRGYLQREG